ncbi:hypothetical protein B0H10DRAFT_2078805, partial [Mycena sp. CBHHK59/15]
TIHRTIRDLVNSPSLQVRYPATILRRHGTYSRHRSYHRQLMRIAATETQVWRNLFRMPSMYK